jgi:hypothetical protein
MVDWTYSDGMSWFSIRMVDSDLKVGGRSTAIVDPVRNNRIKRRRKLLYRRRTIPLIVRMSMVSCVMD